MHTVRERELKEEIEKNKEKLLDYFKANKKHFMKDGTLIHVSQHQIDVWRN